MSKPKNVFVCTNCGGEFSRWLGRCPDCNEWGTLSEEEKVETSSSNRQYKKIKPLDLSKVKKQELERISSKFGEFDRVLGGSTFDKTTGFTPGQVILLSGEPGVGKSTLLLQLLLKLGEENIKSLYVSAEESLAQVAQRAYRIKSGQEFKLEDYDVKVLNGYEVEGIISAVRKVGPKILVVDSIQTIFSNDSNSLPGSVSQVKLCSSKLVNFAKSEKIVLILVGHINKEGMIAGPKVLEHMVDSIFRIEGDEKTNIKILRSLKNRFGPTNEIGLFKMTSQGLKDLKDPSKMFKFEKDEKLVGVCKSIVVEGQRPLVVEVQALTNKTPYSLPKRVAEGIPLARLQRIGAIISKYTAINFMDKDIYIKIAGGLKVDDPAMDLAVALSMISSLKKKSLSFDLISLGELNLTGSISDVPRFAERAKEAKRLGYKTIISSKNYKKVSELVKFVVSSKK
ncbi:DNA repair protein RadA [Candidatus Dojkabacteria bacterium]|nr:DNA repair protein RadA [Candidatus Dojkabacteria bacterium]